MVGFKKTNMTDSIAGRNDIKTGIPFFSPKGGENGKWVVSRIRILPPREDHPTDRFYHWVAVHGNLPGSEFPVYCPSKNDGEPCTACQLSRDFYNHGDKENGGKFGARFRGMINLILLNQDGSLPDDSEVKVWAMPKDLLDDLCVKILELPEDEQDITDPLTGRDVILRRKGTGVKDTKYEIAINPTSTEIPAEAVDLLDTMHDLTAIYAKTSGERIKALLEAPETPAGLLPAGDPFDADDTGALDGEFTELFPPDSGDDDEDPGTEPEPTPTAKQSAKELLEARLKARQAAAAKK